MATTTSLLALAGPARPGEPNPLASLVLMGLIFAIFYFVLILPMRNKQRKLEELVKGLKTGDKVILNSGHLRHHRGRRGRRLPGPHRRQDPDQGPEERRGRPAGTGDREGEEVDAARPAEPLRPLAACSTAALGGLVYAFMRPELRLAAIALRRRSSSPAASPSGRPIEHEGQPGKIHLGLDLQRRHAPRAAGGASTTRLNATIDDAVQTTRDQATRKGIAVARASSARRPPSFAVEGVEPARVKDMRDIAARLLPRRLGDPGAGRGPLRGAR